jgi:hypothetical protein
LETGLLNIDVYERVFLMRKCLVLLGIVLIFPSLFPAIAHASDDAKDAGSDYIDKLLQTAMNQLPKLAWVLQSGGVVVAQSDSQELRLYSSAETVETVHLKSTLSTKNSLAFSKKNRVDCDLSDTLNTNKSAHLSLYGVSTLKSKYDEGQQVLSTENPVQGLQVGFEEAPLPKSLEKEVWGKIHPDSAQQPRLASVFRREGVPYFYSVAGFYSGPDKALWRKGLFLHDGTGRIIASKIDDVKGEENCAGCDPAKFDDGIRALYDVLNIVTGPQFPYPLLLLNADTLEGRAKALATFSPDGKLSEHFFYEYSNDCGDNRND